jgi:hypothetical protein
MKIFVLNVFYTWFGNIAKSLKIFLVYIYALLRCNFPLYLYAPVRNLSMIKQDFTCIFFNILFFHILFFFFYNNLNIFYL